MSKVNNQPTKILIHFLSEILKSGKVRFCWNDIKDMRLCNKNTYVELMSEARTHGYLEYSECQEGEDRRRSYWIFSNPVIISEIVNDLT